jgi:hypothetical protein
MRLGIRYSPLRGQYLLLIQPKQWRFIFSKWVSSFQSRATTASSFTQLILVRELRLKVVPAPKPPQAQPKPEDEP